MNLFHATFSKQQFPNFELIYAIELSEPANHGTTNGGGVKEYDSNVIILYNTINFIDFVYYWRTF